MEPVYFWNIGFVTAVITTELLTLNVADEGERVTVSGLGVELPPQDNIRLHIKEATKVKWYLARGTNCIASS